MTFAAQMKQDLVAFFNDDEFAENIEYRELQGVAPVTVRAIVDLAFDTEIQSLVDSTLALEIPADGITGIVGVRKPQPGDTMIIRGHHCRLKDVTSNPEGTHELTVDVGAPE